MGLYTAQVPPASLICTYTIRRPNIGRFFRLFPDFLEFSGLFFRSWAQFWVFFDVRIEFCMSNCIFSQPEMSVGPNFNRKTSKIQKLGPNFGRRYVWATDRIYMCICVHYVFDMFLLCCVLRVVLSWCVCFGLCCFVLWFLCLCLFLPARSL